MTLKLFALAALAGAGLVGCGDDGAETSTTMDTETSTSTFTSTSTSTSDGSTSGTTSATEGSSGGSTETTSGTSDGDTTSTGGTTDGSTGGDTDGTTGGVVDVPPQLDITSPAPLTNFVPNFAEVIVTIAVADLQVQPPGGENVPGEGHIGVYLDGALLEVLTQVNFFGDAETAEFTTPATGGIHRLRAIALQNDGTPYDDPEAEAHSMFWVDDGREHVAIVSPEPNTEVVIGAEDLEVQIAVLNFDLKRSHGAPDYAPWEGHAHTLFDTTWGDEDNTYVFPDLENIEECVAHCQAVAECEPEADCHIRQRMVFPPPGQVAHEATYTAEPMIVADAGEYLYSVMLVYNGMGHPMYYRSGTEPVGHVNYTPSSTETAELVLDRIPLTMVAAP